MLTTTKIIVTVSGKNKAWYENKGYVLPYAKDSRGRVGIKKGTKMEVSIESIHPSSNLKVSYACDDCGQDRQAVYSSLAYRKNSQYLKTGETLCSACANKRLRGKNNPNYKHGNDRYCEYRCNSKRRGIEFNLSVEEFVKLVSKECHYCGGNSSEWETNSRGNGIDRKDSSQGYFVHNCVPCCSKCNFVKNNMGYEQFISYVTRIYNRVSREGACCEQ